MEDWPDETDEPEAPRPSRAGRGRGAGDDPPSEDTASPSEPATAPGTDARDRLLGRRELRPTGRRGSEFIPPPPARPDPGPAPLAHPRLQNPRSLALTSRMRTSARIEPLADLTTRDLLIVPRNAGFRAAELGIRAVVSYLHTTQMMTPTGEERDGDDLVITLGPSAFAHLMFTEGSLPEGPPAILEGALFAGASPRPLPWGDPDRRACFWLALLGARFHRLNEAFRTRLQQILYLGPELVDGEHDPTRLSPTARAAESARVQAIAFEEF